MLFPNVKMNCTLSKNQCHLNQICFPYLFENFNVFPLKNIYSFEGSARTSGWNHIATSPTRKRFWRVREPVVETTSPLLQQEKVFEGSASQRSKPHRHLSNKKKFNGPIFFPYFVSHIFLKILLVPNLSICSHDLFPIFC